MFICDVRMDVSKALKTLDALGRNQIPFATAQAINAVTWAVKSKSGPAEMKRVFDRPTPWVLRSLMTKKADKRRLTGKVGWGEDFYSKANHTPVEIMQHQISGGARARKSLELWLERKGLIAKNEYIAPGGGAKLDPYGNLSRGQTAQILSQLKLGNDPYSWSSNRPRSRKNQAKAGKIFWSNGRGVGSQHLPRGAYLRSDRSVLCLLKIISKPSYKPRFNLNRVGQAEIARTFQPAFHAAMARALSGTRL